MNSNGSNSNGSNVNNNAGNNAGSSNNNNNNGRGDIMVAQLWFKIPPSPKGKKKGGAPPAVPAAVFALEKGRGRGGLPLSLPFGTRFAKQKTH